VDEEIEKVRNERKSRRGGLARRERGRFFWEDEVRRCERERDKGRQGK
jgi:hypothetical protein